MKLTREEVREVAHLARIEMSDAEIDEMTEQLGVILDYAAALNELNLEGVEPTYHVMPVVNVMRDDVPGRPGGPECALGDAPDRFGDFYRAPRVIDDGEGH